MERIKEIRERFNYLKVSLVSYGNDQEMLISIVNELDSLLIEIDELKEIL